MSNRHQIPSHAVGRPGTSRTGWRFFPWYVGGGIGVAAVVNGVLAWLAVASFPGLATRHGFNDSNGYDRVLASAQRQAALGWTVQDRLEGARPVLTLAGRDGAPLPDPHVTATVERPIGTDAPAPLSFEPAGPGRYEAGALDPGKWDIDLTVTSGADAFHTVRRVVVK